MGVEAEAETKAKGEAEVKAGLQRAAATLVSGYLDAPRCG